MMKKIPVIYFLLIGAILVTGCKNATVDNSDQIMTRREQKYKKVGDLLDDDALLFGGGREKSTGNNPSHLSVNSYLWRASLDTLSFMPLIAVDPFGGVILTDWYSQDPSGRERVKIDVVVSSRQLRSDGVKVRLFRQTFKDGQWTFGAPDHGAETDLENAILRRARELKVHGKKQG